MEHILLNNKSSVAYDDSIPEDIKVFIDNKEHDFKDSTENRIDYAIAIKRNKYAKTLNHQFENLVLLTGAGSSIDWGVDGKVGQSMVNLWDGVELELGTELFSKLLDVIKYNIPLTLPSPRKNTALCSNPCVKPFLFAASYSIASVCNCHTFCVVFAYAQSAHCHPRTCGGKELPNGSKNKAKRHFTPHSDVLIAFLTRALSSNLETNFTFFFIIK